MMTWLKVLSVVLGLAVPLAVHAAQEAVVVLDQAPIREEPQNDAKVIQSLPSGTKVRISSYSKNGWYKTKSQNGQFGWIWQSDLEVSAMSSDLKSADLELKDKSHERRSHTGPVFFIKGGGLLFGIISSDVSNRLGLGPGHFFFAPGGFIELDVRVAERLRLGLRGAAYSSSSSTLFNAVAYNVALSGMPILIGLDADVAESSVFDVSAGIYGGFAFNNTLTVTTPAYVSPNEVIFQANNYAVFLNFSGKYHLSQRLAAIAEAGLYYSRIPAATVPAGFNGDIPFRDASGNLSTLLINHLGPMLSLGFQVSI